MTIERAELSAVVGSGGTPGTVQTAIGAVVLGSGNTPGTVQTATASAVIDETADWMPWIGRCEASAVIDSTAATVQRVELAAVIKDGFIPCVGRALMRLASSLHRVFSRDADAKQLLCAVLQPPGEALDAAADDVQEAIDQIHLDRADADFLDVHARDYYGFPRAFGEYDTDYRARMIATIIQPRSNNVAIQLELARHLKVSPDLIQVNDADTQQLGGKSYLDGTWYLNGDRVLNGYRIQGIPHQYASQFDVLIDESIPIADVPGLLAIINQFKAAGTRLRYLTRGRPLYLDGTWYLDGTQYLNGNLS